MDQPTESISPDDGPSRQDDGGFARPEWWHLSQGTMRTVTVVVIGVLSQHGLHLSASEDEHPVQHLTPNGADPSLRVGIRPWRPHRSAQHAKARVMHAVQQPIAGSAFNDVMGQPAWKSLPTWFLIAKDDEALPPDAERQFAARMGATTVEVPSSHVAMVSHPADVVDLIETAAQTVTTDN
jgi:pimeloyl-ACP methyl ester carboxylesterase